MHQAHLILFFDVRTGVPVFSLAGIYGETADTLTTDLSGKTLTVTAASSKGGDFGEARLYLYDQLRHHPFYRDWIFDHLEPEPIDAFCAPDRAGHIACPHCRMHAEALARRKLSRSNQGAG